MSLVEFPENYQPIPMAPSRRILREVCKEHGLLVENVTGPRRFLPLVKCRTEIAARVAKETKLSFPQIGALLGKDHTTIIMAIRRWNEATGDNIRGLGIIPEATRARNLASAQKNVRPLTRKERLHRSRMEADRRVFYAWLAEAVQ